MDREIPHCSNCGSDDVAITLRGGFSQDDPHGLIGNNYSCSACGSHGPAANCIVKEERMSIQDEIEQNNSNGDTNGSQPLALQCPVCQRLTNFRNPEAHVSAHPKVTTITLIHDKFEDCPKCGSCLSLQAGVMQGSIVLMVIAIQKPDDASKIIDPKGFRVPGIRGN